MHAHPHGHPHGHGAHQKPSPPIFTKTNIIHFSYLIVTTIGYFNIFSFQSFIGTFIIYILWCLICALICATVITPIVLQRPSVFLIRYMTLALVGFVLCSFFIDWKARAVFSRDVFSQRIVHLDMKAAPPTVKYLESFFPLLASFGATGVLIEWDNMFPYQDTEKFRFSVARSQDSYTKEEVTKIINLAKSNGLKVYPLIQSFGQLDFLLKHEEFEQYRAVKNRYGTIHPMNLNSKEVIIALIDQVLAMHPKVDMVHLGGSQVDLDCPNCATKTPDEIFLNFMSPIFEYLKEKKLKVLIWDDVIRAWPDEKLLELVPVCEVVAGRPGEISERNSALENYFRLFKTIWTSTPFRGDGKSHFPLIKDYVAHAVITARIGITAKQEHGLPPMSGVILSGFAKDPNTESISEILPASVPSLAFTLATLRTGQVTEKVEERLLQQLGLQGLHYSGSNKEKLCNEAIETKASFAGSQAFKMAAELELTKRASDSDINPAIDGILKPRAAKEIEDKLAKFQ